MSRAPVEPRRRPAAPARPGARVASAASADRIAATVRTLGELGPGVVLSPERYLSTLRRGDGVPLGELVVERRRLVDPSLDPELVVCDTSHAHDGRLDLASAVRDGAGTKSPKKLAFEGDLLVSRLRPYLRQVAFVHPEAFVEGAFVEGARRRPSRPRRIALSTEFYVLAPKTEGDDLAYLTPYLLSDEIQAALASAQEGGHHPRVPIESLLSLTVPKRLVADRKRASRRVRDALAAVYLAERRLRTVLGEAPRRLKA